MKTFIITLLQNKHSVESAERARQSAVDVGYRETIETFEAITPDLWEEILPYDNNFDNYARPDNVGACFASHYLLWQKCIELGEPILILEHDAIFVDNIPDIDFDMCVNFGRSGAVKVLQQAANSKSRNKISVDGGIGPATLNAIQKISVDVVRAYRVLRFANIVIDKPNQEKFWLGWFRRAIEV